MRDGISIEVSAADGERLAAVVTYRNSPQKQVWRAWFILATAEGCGTLENHAPRRGFQAPCVALARAVHARRRRGPAARQDQKAQHAAVVVGARRGGIVPERVRLMDDGARVAYRHPVERDGETWLQEVRAPAFYQLFLPA